MRANRCALLDAFSYVSGLTTVALALGIARLLVGVGRLMERRTQIRLYWVHLMWAANLFLFLSLQWWILFRWQSWTDWNRNPFPMDLSE